MPSTALRRCAQITTALAISLTVLSAPASAQRLVRNDPAGDLVVAHENETIDLADLADFDDFRVSPRRLGRKMLQGDLDDMPPMSPAPKTRNGDITRVFFDHGRRKVTVRIKMRAFQAPRVTGASDDTMSMAGAGFDLVDGRGVHSTLFFLRDAGGSEWDWSRNERSVRCRGMKRSFAGRTHTLTAVIPRACLGRPGRLRISPMSIAMRLRVTGNDRFLTIDSATYLDDGMRTGMARSGMPSYSRPVLHR